MGSRVSVDLPAGIYDVFTTASRYSDVYYALDDNERTVDLRDDVAITFEVGYEPIDLAESDGL